MAGKKVQVPVLGGLRKVIAVTDNSAAVANPGTTIAEFGSQTVSLAQLKIALGITTKASAGNTASLVPGPGLSGGGVLTGTVPINLVAPIPWMMGSDDGEGDSYLPGPPGKDGTVGATGPRGSPGLDGETGEDGERGPPGTQGPAGSAGAPGVTFFMEELGEDSYAPGPSGPAGAQGLPGVQGFPGLDGEPGEDGFRGPQGCVGPAGAPGATFFLEESSGESDSLFAPVYGGNPSVLVGLTAKKGSSNFFMPADAAPALDQSISPTMTGDWVFSHNASGGPAAAVRLAGTGGNSTVLSWGDLSAPADEKWWDVFARLSILQFRGINDANSARSIWLAVTRTGLATTNIAFGNATDNQSVSFLGTGNVFFDNPKTITSSGLLTFAADIAFAAGHNITMDTGGVNKYLLTEETNTGTGSLTFQAGAGSAGYGGGFVLYANAHATYPGDVWFGRSSGSAGRLRFGDGGTGPQTEFGRFTTENSSKIQLLMEDSTSSVSFPSYSWNNDPDTGFYHIGANNFAAACNGVKRVEFSAGTAFTVYGVAGNNTASLQGAASDDFNFVFGITGGQQYDMAIRNSNGSLVWRDNTAAVDRLTLSSAGFFQFGSALRLANYTVSTLPSASSTGAGSLAFVTDATLTAITGLGLAVIGGGSNKVVVYSDGTNWIIL